MNEYVHYGLKHLVLYPRFSAEIFASPGACGQGVIFSEKKWFWNMPYDVIECVTLSFHVFSRDLGIWKAFCCHQKKMWYLAIRKQQQNTALAFSLYSREDGG